MPVTVKLDDLLHQRRLTLTDLADRVGITLANLSVLKTGKAARDPLLHARGAVRGARLPAGGSAGLCAGRGGGAGRRGGRGGLRESSPPAMPPPTPLTPFVLSLSKDCPFLQRHREEERSFDRLRTNGVSGKADENSPPRITDIRSPCPKKEKGGPSRGRPSFFRNPEKKIT